MPKAIIDQVFDSAVSYYHKNNKKITRSLTGYDKFEQQCKALIASNKYDIDTSLTQMQQFKQLNAVFDKQNSAVEYTNDELKALI